jgi:hypothetical protein
MMFTFEVNDDLYDIFATALAVEMGPERDAVASEANGGDVVLAYASRQLRDACERCVEGRMEFTAKREASAREKAVKPLIAMGLAKDVEDAYALMELMRTAKASGVSLAEALSVRSKA